MKLVKNVVSEPKDARTLVEELVALFFTNMLNEERFNFFLNELLLYQLPAEHWATEWENYLATNDDTAIRPQLQNLLSGMLISPESQVC